MMKNLFIYLFAFLSFVSLAKNQNQALFEQAVKDYNEGKYQVAVDAYSTILESGQASVALYYNLANAYYKLNKVGESVYYYEKALQLSPNDEDVKNNLAFAKQMTIDDIKPLPRTFFQRIHDKVTQLYSISTWAWISIVMMLFFVVFFLLYFFKEATFLKRLYFTLASFVLLLSIATFGIAYYRDNVGKNEISAILFDKEVPIYSEPNSYSQEIFALHEGTKVTVLETLDQWKKIRLADGRIGWAKTSSMKVL